MLSIVLILAILSVVNAGCDNQCSGHGVCGQRGVCECYDNWGMGFSRDSGDCSERVCPFEFAWVDKPNEVGLHHQYAECSARGICQRDSGECECFPGYEGKACQRTGCPNECSGHGQCAYIEDLPLHPSHHDAPYRDTKGYFYETESSTYLYNGWDEMKTRGCICDPEYGDVDCSKRLCQHATDVMDQRDDMTTGYLHHSQGYIDDAVAQYHTQTISFVGNSDTGTPEKYATGGETFALKFISKLNESFVTHPIVMPAGTAGSECLDFILQVQTALLKLPNKVIDGVHVSAACDDFNDGTGAANNLHVDAAGAGYITTLNVTFTGMSVQGKQNMLVPVTRMCGDGCTPKLTGLELLPRTMNVTETITSDFNSYECGNRGKCDYSSGICSCFEGYTGLACNIITSLV